MTSLAAGLCVLRDARDIVPYLCGHYLRLGIDRLVFIDDGSTDGTFEFLQEVSRRTPRVRVRQVLDERFRQADLMSAEINRLIGEGFPIVLPFDADEFWDLRPSLIDGWRRRDGEFLIRARWVHFVQDARATFPSALGLFGIRHRAPALADADADGVSSYRRPFVCSSDVKVAVRSQGPIEIGPGQHALVSGPDTPFGRDLEMFHVPFRWKSELTKRGSTFHRRRPDAPAGHHWQSRFHRDAVRSGRLDPVWAANSAGPGHVLHAYGDLIPLARDDRLRRLLLRAAWHLAVTLRASPA